MSIQRWTVADPARMSVVPAQEGDLVTYADFDAAVTAAYDSGLVHGLVEGRAHALVEARDAVAALRSGSWGTDYDGVEIDMADALAAIDGLKATP